MDFDGLNKPHKQSIPFLIAEFPSRLQQYQIKPIEFVCKTFKYLCSVNNAVAASVAVGFVECHLLDSRMLLSVKSDPSEFSAIQ